MKAKSLVRFKGVLPLLAVTFLSFQPVQAVDDREAFAVGFLASKNLQLQTGPEFSFDRVTRLGEITVYELFNPPSFVLLESGPINPSVLGYSTDNLFYDGANLPDLAMMFLSSLSGLGSLKSGKQGTTGGDGRTVGPLILTHWGQGRFFNYYCPRDPRGPNGRLYPGCVAVAMAQVIRYYGHYNNFGFTHSYPAGSYGNLTARLGGYNWAMMETDPVSVNRDISDLLFDLSVLVHTSFGITGSSANSHRTLEAFHELGYHDAILFRRRDFSAEAWTDLFYSSLADDSSPVLVTGGGHAFLCDGFDREGFYHFNLGGAGYADGYYPLSIVLNYNVSEAFINLSPISHLPVPGNLRILNCSGETTAAWSAPSDLVDISYKIYVDEVLWDETADTTYRIDFLSPGIHTIHLSSKAPYGESRWIGPANVFVKGSRLTFRENEVHRAIFKALGYPYGDTGDAQISEGDLYRITSMEIGDPGEGVGELSLCTGLRKLVIRGTSGEPLSLDFLENLIHLKVLELYHLNLSNPDKISALTQISELRLVDSPTGNIDFLIPLQNLMKFEYSESPPSDPAIFSSLPFLDDLTLRGAGIKDAGFIGEIYNLQRIDLSDNSIETLDGIDFPGFLADLRIPGNLLTSSAFLADIEHLVEADLSDNRIRTASFLSGLKYLKSIDLSGNQIDQFILSTDLTNLTDMDFSRNKLTGTGRLFYYTPALKSLDLSYNRIIDPGENSCQSLERIDLSHNRLITTDWACLNPALVELDLHDNCISDLSGLMRNDCFRQLKGLKIEGNPVSKESFDHFMPMLQTCIPAFSGPAQYEPLSPCFPSPGNGSRITRFPAELKWQAEDEGLEVVYDLFCLKGDSLITMLSGLSERMAVLETRPAGSFEWVVGARVAGSVYYSGAYACLTNEPLPLPFFEGFENFPEGGELGKLCPYWEVQEDVLEGSTLCQVCSKEAHAGNHSLEIAGFARAGICLDQPGTPVLSVRFFAYVPEGKSASFRMGSFNGLNIRASLDPEGKGTIFLNELPVNKFIYDQNTWILFRAEVMARHNRIFLWMGEKLVINQPWTFPKGEVAAGNLEFGPDLEMNEEISDSCLLYIDDLSVTIAETSGSGDLGQPWHQIEIFPNPFSEFINLRLPDTSGWIFILTDAAGRTVNYSLLDPVPGSVSQVLPGNLPPGVYMARLYPIGQNKSSGLSSNGIPIPPRTFRLVKNQSEY